MPCVIHAAEVSRRHLRRGEVVQVARRDYVLTAVNRATAVPIENLVFSVLKIGLLVAVALAAVPGGIALSWVVATALIVLPINLWLLIRLLPAHGGKSIDRAVPITAGAVGRFVGADYVGALFWQAALMGLPVLVRTVSAPRPPPPTAWSGSSGSPCTWCPPPWASR